MGYYELDEYNELKEKFDKKFEAIKAKFEAKISKLIGEFEEKAKPIIKKQLPPNSELSQSMGFATVWINNERAYDIMLRQEETPHELCDKLRKFEREMAAAQFQGYFDADMNHCTGVDFDDLTSLNAEIFSN